MKTAIVILTVLTWHVDGRPSYTQQTTIKAERNETARETCERIAALINADTPKRRQSPYQFRATCEERGQ